MSVVRYINFNKGDKMTIRELISKLSLLLFVLITTIVGLGGVGSYYINKKMTDANETSKFFSRALADSVDAQIAFQRQVQEWKNILIRGNDSELYDKYLAAFGKQEASMDKHLKELATKLKEQKLSTEHIDKLINTHAELGKKYRSALESAWSITDAESGKKVDLLLRGIDRDTSSQMDTLAKELRANADKKLDSLQEEAALLSKYTMYAAIAVAILGLLILRISTRRAARNILGIVGSEPAELNTVFSAIANGDLTVKVPLKEGDKTSMTAQIALMQRKIKNMVASVKNGSVELETAAEKILETEDVHDIKGQAREARKAARGLQQATSRFQVE